MHQDVGAIERRRQEGIEHSDTDEHACHSEKGPAVAQQHIDMDGQIERVAPLVPGIRNAAMHVNDFHVPFL
ncbi:hypothetical protein D3C72_1856710 [compost metagenome]